DLLRAAFRVLFFLQELALESNKRTIKKQFLEDDEQSLEGDKIDKKLPSIVQHHLDQNKSISKSINIREITKASSKMDSVEIPME
ncbi:9271_t:CDS:2, partial [Cetraspora pellucida]